MPVNWTICSVFTLQSSIPLLFVGMLVWMSLMPAIEAAEQTVLQQVVPYEKQGRVFGFAQTVESAASPFTALLIGPIAQFAAIPFMTDGRGADLIGGWFGTGDGTWTGVDLHDRRASSASSPRSPPPGPGGTASCRPAPIRRRPTRESDQAEQLSS